MHKALYAIARRSLCNRQRALFIGHKKIIALECADDPRNVNHNIGIPREVIEGGAVLQIALNLPHLWVHAGPRRIAHQSRHLGGFGHKSGNHGAANKSRGSSEGNFQGHDRLRLRLLGSGQKFCRFGCPLGNFNEFTGYIFLLGAGARKFSRRGERQALGRHQNHGAFNTRTVMHHG